MLQRKKIQVMEAFINSKNLDAFPKLQDDYKERSSTRGTVSIVVFLVILIFIMLELRLYFEKKINYNYSIDFDYTSKLKLNVDITIAMPCKTIGADVIDNINKDILTDQSINLEDTWFELSPKQKLQYEQISNLFNKIRSNYFAIHSNMWTECSDYKQNLIEREILPNYPKDACRVHGTFNLNKISGVFHIIYGRSVSFFGNHAHVINMFENLNQNFSHRIDKFSFGENSELIHNALNNELKITNEENKVFQYFISIVPTAINTRTIYNTYQYSVTENTKKSKNLEAKNHDSPGIFFKYDISPIKVKVEVKHKSFIDFGIDCIGIIGGIFSTSFMLYSILQAIKDFFFNKLK